MLQSFVAEKLQDCKRWKEPGKLLVQEAGIVLELIAISLPPSPSVVTCVLHIRIQLGRQGQTMIPKSRRIQDPTRCWCDAMLSSRQVYARENSGDVHL